MSKRPAEQDSEDDVVIVGGGGEKAVGGGGDAKGGAKPKKAAPKKAKKKNDGEGGEEEVAAPKAKKAVKLKPFTPEEVEIAKGASMERNAQIVAFLETVAQGYKDEAAWFKVANAKKAIASVKALTEPIRVAQELGSLDGCGKGTIEKVAEYLKGLGKPEEGFAAVHAAQVAAEGKEEAFEWLKDTDKAVVLQMVAEGAAPKAQAIAWHPDISEADFQ